MAVSKKAKAIYTGFFDGIEIFAANTISNIQERRLLKKYAPKEPIPKEYAKAYRAYWKQFGINANPLWGWYYAARNGNMDVRYVPHTLYYTKIDQHFNARKLGYGFNDKNYYSKIFAGIKQPETVLRIFGGGYYTNSDYQIVTYEDAVNLILENDEVICKPSQESGSGRSIQFWNTKEDADKIRSFLKNPEGAFIVQKLIKQHKDLERLHTGSINTIRIATILLDDNVYVLSACQRMGSGNSRVDNHHAGGMSVGINQDGTLQKYAYYLNGDRVEKHPDGFIFEGYKVIGFSDAVCMVKKAHQILGHFRLVGWDIAINQDGIPVMVECNMRKNGIELHQFSNGPLFGELTERVINMVYRKG